MNPKTKAVVEAFLDLDAPENLRPMRKEQLRSSRPKLFEALEDLTKAVAEKNLI